jgi:hypothetical protein
MAKFQFDPKEAALGDEFLTPVYFKKEVLIRYMYDPSVYFDFASDTYGRVIGKGFSIPFGINKNDNVIAWLGDLNDLPEDEQKRFALDNIPSDHDMKSDFFDSQLLAKFTGPTRTNRCLNAVAKLNGAFHAKFGTYLYKPKSIESRIKDAARYKKLLIGNPDDFKRFVSELNEIINENVDNDAIRQLLAAKSINVAEGAKGNKLLEAIYKNILGDNKNLVAPFFYLYDLRLWADHALGDKPRDDVAAKLGVNKTDDYAKLMDALLDAIETSADQLINLI